MIPHDDLARRIRLGEDSTLELKRVLLSGPRVTSPERRDFADELASIANGPGGTVMLGIDDVSHDVLGIPLDRLDAVETWVREICNDSLRPPLDATIRKTELPDAAGSLVAVIRIDVPRSLFVHRSPGGYFRRIGSSKREMSPEMLVRLFQERSQSRVIRFDESVVPGTTFGDLDDELTRRFLRRGGELAEDDLRKLRVVAADELDFSRLTVAGVLMCTRAPGNWLPHAQIQAVSYAGERNDVNYQTDARDIVGPLDSQVVEALHFVDRNMLVNATKEVARAERPQFSERAVFEALVNAVAHRDYSMAGARIRLHMFGNRIELYVPGSLANTLTPDSMHLRQYSRNELIVSLLTRCTVPSIGTLDRTHMMERRGDGVPIILEESFELSGIYPEYTLIDDSELRLVIWSAESDASGFSGEE
jgi:predicted HTH transcriptional regulator